MRYIPSHEKVFTNTYEGKCALYDLIVKLFDSPEVKERYRNSKLMLQNWKIEWIEQDEKTRPNEREVNDDTDKIMVFQSPERPRGVGVRNCFEFEAKDVGDTQGPTLFVRRNGCGLQCCMMMRYGIRDCERDQEAEFTFLNLPNAEFEEEKDLEEVEEHDERSSNILRMQRGADDT